VDILAIYQNEQISHPILISLFFLITWFKSTKGTWLIDDDFGIAQFSDKFRPEQKTLKDGKTVPISIPNYNMLDGEIIPELKVDYYNLETGKDAQGKPVITTFKNLCYNSFLGFPGAFMRWHRLHIGKKFTTIAKNKDGHPVYGYEQSSFRHHVWSLFIHLLNVNLVYFFLSNLFGRETAFYATLIFSVHPVSSQCVAWISGINYLYSLLFALLNFVTVQNISDYHWTIPLTVILTFASGMTLLTGCFNWVILLMLGRKWEALAAFLCSIIIFIRDGIGVLNFRKSNFKEQNMEKSTIVNFRKPIVILKTFWYYVKLMIIPSNLGLYHEFGYHYDDLIERINPMVFKGLLAFSALVISAIYAPFIVTFSIVWMISYWLVFCNIITANQFVVERYIFIPSLGYSIILAYLLKGHPIIWLVIGLYMMRSICHVWSFLSQKDFYLSNWLNFRNSEVALGNLGVCYVNEGKTGTAIDIWQQAAKINEFYDVAWYNLFSIFKSHGMLLEAKGYLEKCLKSKTIHFKTQWEKEYKELCDIIDKNTPKVVPIQEKKCEP